MGVSAKNISREAKYIFGRGCNFAGCPLEEVKNHDTYDRHRSKN
jgi:hypothetical protein